MKKLINLLTSFSLFTLSTTNVIACMDNGTDEKKKRAKKIVVPHEDNEEDEEDGLLALEMEEKIDKLSLISINAKTTANGINRISNLIEELKTNQAITDITDDVEFKITASEEEEQILQPSEYQLTIQLLKPDSDRSNEDNNEEGNTTEEELQSEDNSWTTTFKVNVNNELTEEDKSKFKEIFTAIEQQLNTSEFSPAKIITSADLEETLRNLILETIAPYENFALVKIENKSERFKANDYLYQNGEGIDFNVVLKAKYNKTTFDNKYNIKLDKWDSLDIIKSKYVNEIKAKLFEKIGSLNKTQIDSFQPLLEQEIKTLSNKLPNGITNPFTLDTWKQVCKLLAVGIDPLSEEQINASDNEAIKKYSFAEWKYLKSTLFQTFYFKDIKDLIVNFKNKFKGKIDITFKFQQQVDDKIYTYDQSDESKDIDKLSIFKYNKTDNTVIYPKGKNFNFRLIAIIDGQEYEASLTPWKPFSKLDWAEDCYFLPIALMWAVNNYFNTYSLQEQIEEK